MGPSADRAESATPSPWWCSRESVHSPARRASRKRRREARAPQPGWRVSPGEFYYHYAMTTRRRFVAALTSFAGLGFASQAQPAAGGWDLSWLDRFKGKHKQVFDLGSFDLSIDTPLRVPMNYLDTFRDVYRLEPPAINVAVGISRAAFPMNASDALWKSFHLGERWGIKDPATGQPATRNIF